MTALSLGSFIALGAASWMSRYVHVRLVRETTGEPIKGCALVPTFPKATRVAVSGNLETEISPVLSYIFASCRGDNRPYLSVNVFGLELCGLLDSGASRTVIGSKGWKLLSSLKLSLSASVIKNCSVANNNKCSVIGELDVPFNLEGKFVLLQYW